MRVVLDTNVFISGIFWEGNFCSQIIDKWKNKEFELISSVDIVDELMKTLKSFKIQMSDEMIEAWKCMVIENSLMVEPVERLHVVKDDPDDDKFLEVGLAGKADLVVSQDKHLLKLNGYGDMKIVGPEDALDLISGNSG